MRAPLPDAAAIAALPADGGAEFNRLVFEASPYLRQHARNPVDWYPWGPEALARAQREDKPIFLSVGYATCHWCHVIEHESVEDAATAALMNAHYVCVKVDRGERPDLDAAMMTATQLFTGRGGWPNSLWLTSDGKPWFCGTYFPREDRGPQRPGFKSMLIALREIWDTRRADALAQADTVVEAIVKSGALPDAVSGAPAGRALVDAALSQLAADFDPVQGGFGGAPKFPPHQALALLLDEHARSGDEALLRMATRTLEAMAAGGIHDQLGGGFHRYSTDARWLLPHFEKMLSDNALLLPMYAEAARRTGRGDFAAVARGIAGWALRDMRDAAGGFHTALDADSEGEEGRFYVWTLDELRSALGRSEGDRFAARYQVQSDGNFLEEATGQRTGANVLCLSEPPDERDEAEEDVETAGLSGSMEEARKTLLAVREGRVRPSRDEKILTDWNGLMISALARGAFITGEKRYEEAARRAADFLLSTLCTRDGALLHRYCGGEAGIPGHLEDYAFLAQGLLDLYEATFETRYLEEAVRLTRRMIDRFHDSGHGGFFFTADDAEALIVRAKDVQDGAIPSGNSVAALNLLRLARITGDASLERAAQGVFSFFASTVKRIPSGFTQYLMALEFAHAPGREVVVAGAPGSEETRAMTRALASGFRPGVTLLFRPAGEADPSIVRIAPFLRDHEALEGRATAYVCTDHRCLQPTTDPAEMIRLIEAD